MSEILSLLIPFFGLTLLGYGAGRLRLIPADGLAGLGGFAFYVALPALVFLLVAQTPTSTYAGWSFLVTTTFASYCAFAIAFSVAALLNGGRVPEATIGGMIGAQSNIVWLAPALVLGALGNSAAAPMAFILAFDTAMLAIATPLMMALGGTARTDMPRLATAIVKSVALHPLIIAAVLGAIFAALKVPIPTGLDSALSMLRAAAPPLALFTFGLSLAMLPVGKLHVEIPVLALVKLAAHPLIVYLLLSWVGGFPALWVNAAVLMAALPPAMEAVRDAQAYGVYQDRAATAVALTTVLAIATVSITLILILTGTLPTDPFR